MTELTSIPEFNAKAEKLDLPINPDHYAGNDTQKLIAAFAAASATGGPKEVRLNRIFNIHSEVDIPVGVALSGPPGAGVKTINQVTTVTTQAIAQGNGVRVFTVQNAASLVVGMSVMFILAGGGSAEPHDSFGKRNPIITAIAGNTVTIDTRTNINAIASGSTLATASRGLIAKGKNRIEGITIDGNRAQQIHGYWISTTSLLVEGSYVELDAVHVINSFSDGILVAGALGGEITSIKIRGGSIQNTGANPIHFSYANGLLVDGVTVKNGNLNAVGLNALHQGDQGGAITFSDNCKNGQFINNDIENCVAGIGSIDGSPDGTVYNGEIIISHNRIWGCRRPVDLRVSAKLVSVTFNRCGSPFPFPVYDNSTIFIQGVSAAQPVRRIKIVGNELTATRIHAQWCDTGRLSRNEIDITALQAVANSTGIGVYECGNIAVENNTVTGGWIGIDFLQNELLSDTKARLCSCTNNHLFDQRYAAIRGQFAAPAVECAVSVAINQISTSVLLASDGNPMTAGGYTAIGRCAGMFGDFNRVQRTLVNGVPVGATWGGAGAAGNWTNTIVNGVREP